MKMQFQVESPINIKFDVVELDEMIPSMRMRVKLSATQFGHSLEYQGEGWFQCSAWDSFVNGLSLDGDASAALIDIDELFCFRLTSVGREWRLEFGFDKTGFDGTVLRLSFASPLDDDARANIFARIVDFDRWWKQ